jgi:general secretion pathway protein E
MLNPDRIASSARGATALQHSGWSGASSSGEAQNRSRDLQMADAFIAHLARKSTLRESPQVLEGKLNARAADGLGDIDWVGHTKLTASAFADELAAFLGCGRVQRGDLVGSEFAGAQLSARFFKEGRLFPYQDASGRVILAIARPVDAETIRAIEIALRCSVILAVATAEDIDAALASKIETERPSPAVQGEAAASEDNIDDLRDLAGGAPVVRAVDDLLRLAVEQRATDLHIEPFAGALQARVRIDGLLKAVSAPPMSMARGLLSRIKIIAGLNITERRLPQDGRARLVVNGAEIDLRVATMPTMHGEGAVVRLLRKGSSLVALDRIGLPERGEAILRRTLQAPFGMIIVTGPTGSGKTTTLAASLALINEPSRKILTVEDPVEYQIPGISQTQVHPTIGLTFASALRSFLRHDPDVIMVGEMRDSETAHIGVHASLTGHLVLTTLHTNTAAGAITRLIDMGVESFLLASSVRTIVGQRLVRILCEHCKQPHQLTPKDLTQDHRYESLGFAIGEVVHQPKGCEWCASTGFRGRQGVFEVMEVSPLLRRAIGPKTDANELEQLARSEGMTTMTEDGVAKCRTGLTTIDEVFRVSASL